MLWLKSPLAQIAGLSVGMAVLQPLAAAGGANSLLFQFLAAYAMPITIALWVAADMKAGGHTPPLDLPFFVLLAFPLSLLWYCVWTRGGQGLLLALGLVFLSYLPYVTTAVVWVAWAVALQ
ncbi:MAG TPA: hypothetical protein VFV87_14390 [Pirellulaceae bacterium]|nr:hypothetical protein [Pirellulaceae bacterium]